jgi:16S rRNA (guanine527-N7)-methyltransferase
MDALRIAELLQPFLEIPESAGQVPLSAAQLKYISMYIDILLRWNARINLTAVRRPEDIVTRHFGESLFAARHLFPAEKRGESEPELAHQVGRADLAIGAPDAPLSGPASVPRVFDVGSGAGFPGLPIKIWAPNIELTLIESNQKKATFLREVLRTIAMSDVHVFAGRAEDLATISTPHADIVTLRAVERFESVLPVAASLVRPESRLALLIGESQMRSAGDLADNFVWNSPVKVPISDARVLLIGRKGYQYR